MCEKCQKEFNKLPFDVQFFFPPPPHSPLLWKILMIEKLRKEMWSENIISKN